MVALTADLFEEQADTFVSAHEKKLASNQTSIGATHAPAAPKVSTSDSCGARGGHTSASSPVLSSSFRKRLSMLYLDTTYCEPKYLFPPQEECVSFVGRTVAKLLKYVTVGVNVIFHSSILFLMDDRRILETLVDAALYRVTTQTSRNIFPCWEECVSFVGRTVAKLRK